MSKEIEMYGMGDVAHEHGNMLRKIKDKIKEFDVTPLTTKTPIDSINELLRFHTEIIEMIEEIENTC